MRLAAAALRLAGAVAPVFRVPCQCVELEDFSGFVVQRLLLLEVAVTDGPSPLTVSARELEGSDALDGTGLSDRDGLGAQATAGGGPDLDCPAVRRTPRKRIANLTLL
jgi:hypothetical protein